MALRKSPGVNGASGRARGSVYTAQTVADFCEVDLKTVHHWADRGKVPHFRTDGRHLRFRRNDIVRFLRAHGYPLPEALVRARPSVALALTR
jgi:excisionase family DNA binding protein